MFERDGILIDTWVWILVGALTLIVTYRRRSTIGLTTGFMLTFLMNHWFASALYVVSERTLYPPSIVALGLGQSVLGMIAFAFGVMVLAPLIDRLFQPSSIKTIAPPTQISSRQIQMLALIGAAAYFINPITFETPVLSVLVRDLAKFAVLAACLYIYSKMRANAKNVSLYVVGLGGLFTLVSISFAGFASFGSVVAVFLVMFYLSQTKFDLKRIIFLVLVAYIGVSGFVAYMDNRAEIRERVWGGGTWQERLEALGNTVGKFQFFSVDDSLHVALVEIRLNRNYFVGKAVENLEAGLIDYAQGSTLMDALIAPIPRVLWPDKPIISGSSTLFTKFTGIPTTPNTSSGLGILLESYINFGSAGVVVLFALYGLIIGIFDARARAALDSGAFASLAIWLVPGFELIDPIDSLAGVVGAMVSAWLVVNAVLIAFRLAQGKQYQTEPSLAKISSSFPR